MRTKAAIIAITQLLLLTAAESKQFTYQHNLRTFTILDKSGNYWKIIDPPLHWFQRPAPKNIVIEIVSDDEAHKNCMGRNETAKGNTKKIFGCTIQDPKEPDYCRIFVVDNLTSQSRETVIHHERAHCHGWPGYHPTGEALPLPRPNPIDAALRKAARSK